MIIDEHWYTINELMELGQQGAAPFKSRDSYVRLFKEGKVQAILKGRGKVKTYLFQGKDLKAYFETQKVQIWNTSKQKTKENASTVTDQEPTLPSKDITLEKEVRTQSSLTIDSTNVRSAGGATEEQNSTTDS